MIHNPAINPKNLFVCWTANSECLPPPLQMLGGIFGKEISSSSEPNQQFFRWGKEITTRKLKTPSDFPPFPPLRTKVRSPILCGFFLSKTTSFGVIFTHTNPVKFRKRPPVLIKSCKSCKLISHASHAIEDLHQISVIRGGILLFQF